MNARMPDLKKMCCQVKKIQTPNTKSIKKAKEMRNMIQTLSIVPYKQTSFKCTTR